MSFLLTGDLSAFEALCAATQDPRPHPEQGAIEQFGSSVMTEHLDLLCGTALEEHLATFAEGLIGAFHSVSLRLQREHDRAADEVRRLTRDFAGGEIDDVELQEATARAHATQAALRTAEFMRDAAGDTYTSATGEIWSPWRGGSKTLASTAAHLDAREALRAKRAGDHARTNPGDQVVAFRASPQADTQEDACRIFDALNWALTQWPQMKLATTGAKGAEKIAIKWARQKSVDVILARGGLQPTRQGGALPCQRRDDRARARVRVDARDDPEPRAGCDSDSVRAGAERGPSRRSEGLPPPAGQAAQGGLIDDAPSGSPGGAFRFPTLVDQQAARPGWSWRGLRATTLRLPSGAAAGARRLRPRRVPEPEVPFGGLGQDDGHGLAVLRGPFGIGVGGQEAEQFAGDLALLDLAHFGPRRPKAREEGERALSAQRTRSAGACRRPGRAR